MQLQHLDFLKTLSLLQTLLISLVIRDQALTTVYDPIGVSLALNFLRTSTVYTLLASIIEGIWIILLFFTYNVHLLALRPVVLFFSGIVLFFAHSITSLAATNFLAADDASISVELPHARSLYASSAVPQLAFICVIIPCLLVQDTLSAKRLHLEHREEAVKVALEGARTSQHLRSRREAATPRLAAWHTARKQHRG